MAQSESRDRSDQDWVGKASHHPTRPCPVCGTPAATAWRPFCSTRCQDVDLGRWLKGTYFIPGLPPGFAEDEGDG
jgi:hypothetical protein